MRLELANDKLVLRSSAAFVRMIGGVMALVGLLFFVKFLSLTSSFWGIVLGAVFMGGSLIALVMPNTTTEFNLATRTATIKRRPWLSTRTRMTVVPFSEIASVDWRKHDDPDGSDTYTLELERADGRKLSLSAVNVSQPVDDIADIIAEATGIR